MFNLLLFFVGFIPALVVLVLIITPMFDLSQKRLILFDIQLVK